MATNRTTIAAGQQAQPESLGTSSDVVRQIAVVAVTLLTLSVNWAANALPINGLSTKVISDAYPSLFTPAGYVFAIWGVIYLGVAAYTVYQALPGQRTNARLRAIGWIYVASGLLNALWIYLWHNLYVWACVVVIVGMLVCMILITQRLFPWRNRVSRAEWWTTHLTFSIYLAWLCVATIANVSAALVDLGWNGEPLSAVFWTILVLLVATALGLYYGAVRRDVGYVLVLAWAFAGIAAARTGDAQVLVWVAAILSVVMVVLAVRGIATARSSAHATLS